MLNVLYEDNHIIVVEKPVNMPVQADETGDFDLLSAVKAYIKEKYAKPGEVYCGLVHRLDRPVGGVMVFARTSKAASRLAPQFASHSTDKRYAAVVCGRPESYMYLSDFILKNEATRASSVVSQGTNGAKQASLAARCVASDGGLSLLDVSLHSGRHHQIRVQLSHAGYPIWGDQRYNPTAVAGQQIALFAYSLTFEHPVKHVQMTFRAEPRGSAWKVFSLQLKGLSHGVQIHYIDDNIIVVNKPAGISCAAADGDEDSLESRLTSAFSHAYPVHRLDVMTSGLTVFARNLLAKDALDSAIRERRLQKSYYCLVKNRPSERSGRLNLYGIKDSDAAYVRTLDHPARSAFDMITDYRVINAKTAYSGATALEVKLVTGRTHQIRASLAYIGCPILGDDKYGDRILNKSLRVKELCLFAARIGFDFPSGSPLTYLNGKTFSAKPPFIR